MSKYSEKATTIFERHSTKDVLHFTSDGQAFFESNPAANHSATLKDKNVETVKRHEVMKPESEGDTDEDGQLARKAMVSDYTEIFGEAPAEELSDEELTEAIDAKRADKGNGKNKPKA
ncbi:MAG: hypothetical protein ACXVAY_01405 [Mucilaginibacter sp.]